MVLACVWGGILFVLALVILDKQHTEKWDNFTNAIYDSPKWMCACGKISKGLIYGAYGVYVLQGHPDHMALAIISY